MERVIFVKGLSLGRIGSYLAPNLSKMRKVTTIICSIAFAISGIAMAVSTSDPSNHSSYKSMAAATLPLSGNYGVPKTPLMVLGNVPNETPTKSELDSIKIESLKQQLDSVSKERVTKVVRRKVYVPKTIVKRDTVHVPVYYLATRTEGDSACVTTFVVKKAGETCENNQTAD